MCNVNSVFDLKLKKPLIKIEEDGCLRHGLKNSVM